MTRRAARISAVLAEIDHPRGPSARGRRPARGGARGARGRGARRGHGRRRRAARPLPRAQRDRYDDAAPRLELALDLAEALGLPEVFAQALTSKSILYTLPEPARGGAHPARGALELALDQRPARCCGSGDQQPGGRTTSRATATGTPPTLSDRGLELARQRRRPGLGGDLPLRADQRARAARGVGRGAGARRGFAESAGGSVDALASLVTIVECAQRRYRAAARPARRPLGAEDRGRPQVAHGVCVRRGAGPAGGGQAATRRSPRPSRRSRSGPSSARRS